MSPLSKGGIQMSVFAGAFLGFTLGDFHSTQLNITRVTNGDRYTEGLTPNFTDSTTAIPGGDGVYYWKTAHTQKNFTIDFAFDDLREEDIRRLKQVLSYKGVQQLIFDEAPFKKYYVKCSSPPSLKYIPFSDMGDVLNYKGEGSVTLTAFYPYAYSTQEYKSYNGNYLKINNAGDLDMPIQVVYALPSAAEASGSDYRLTLKDNQIYANVVGAMVLKNLKTVSKKRNKQNEEPDKFLCIDMNTHLIEGLDANRQKTGLLYNDQIESGDFFNVPPGDYVLTLEAYNGESYALASDQWTQVSYRELYY